MNQWHENSLFLFIDLLFRLNNLAQVLSVPDLASLLDEPLHLVLRLKYEHNSGS